MGWAKYFEDDMDFMFERQRRMWDRVHEAATEITCTGTLPLTKFIVVVENKVAPSKEIGRKAYEDKSIVCRDCGHAFIFSVKAQKHYSKKQWCAPKRCKSCRDAKREVRTCANVF